jgi:hypothetical protein
MAPRFVAKDLYDADGFIEHLERVEDTG